MTVQQLLEKAREDGKKRAYEEYLDICDGNIEQAEKSIEREKQTGMYQREVEFAIMDCIFDLLKSIRSDASMTEEEKNAVIEEIKKCDEYQKAEERLAMTFANHFYKFQDVYLK